MGRDSYGSGKAPNLMLAHPGSVLIEVGTYEHPEPRDIRIEHPIVAWELTFNTDEWVLEPWILRGVEARRWDWPMDSEDVDVRLELTQTRPSEVVTRYRIKDDGVWERINDDARDVAVGE